MNIEFEETDSKGRYWWKSVEGYSAEMTFSKAGEHLIIIDHTDVSPQLKGQGVGVKLVERVIADARGTGKKIVPLCPFAAAQFRKRPEWTDVLNK